MKHAREDYSRIQDPAHIIPEDEPVFLLRAQDLAAPATILFWANHAESLGSKPNILAAARRQAQEMISWQALHKSKAPDMPVRISLLPIAIVKPWNCPGCEMLSCDGCADAESVKK